jgi:hypothetical protein
MYEDAPEIFKYLPIESGSESRYIKQLWDSFILLSEGKDDVPYFSIIPFHLLFMLAVQYKAYRISAWDKGFFLAKINSSQCRTYGNENKQQLLKNIPLNKESVWDATQSSVKTLCLINEKDLFNLFDIVEIEKDIKDMACVLIDNRNDRLHANGEVDEEAENKIGEYLKILDHIHKKCSEKGINKDIQGNWAEDIEEGDLDLSQFFQSKFLYSQFSPSDFGDVVGDIISAENLDFEQWSQVVNLGLERAYDQTIFELKFIASSDEFDEGKRYNADKILRENNEESPFLNLDDAQDLGII